MLTTLRNAWKIEDIRKGLLYTLFILLLFTFGTRIPVPFLNAESIAEFFRLQNEVGGGPLNQLNLMSGGTLETASVFALGISPYITSSIVVQLLTIAIPYLEGLSKEGPEGRKKIDRITKFVTLGLSILQAIAYYILLRSIRLPDGATALEFLHGSSGFFAGLVITAMFVAGSMLVVWLGQRIDANGIGNGISMILFTGIIARAPKAWTILRESNSKYNMVAPILIALLFLALIISIIVMTSAERRIPVQYAKRVVGRKMMGGQASFLPIKVMMTGVMPVIFAGAILSIPSMIGLFTGSSTVPLGESGKSAGVLSTVLSLFNRNSILYIFLTAALVMLFNYFYIAIQHDPNEMANNLRKNNGTIPGIRPGQPTASFIGRVVNRVTFVGALFLAFIAILPMILERATGIPIGLGGTSIIIAVGVALDTVKELESMMMMRHYKGFLE